ncbi:MAG: c-type cytochrome [Gemmatimonadota bacterium]
MDPTRMPRPTAGRRLAAPLLGLGALFGLTPLLSSARVAAQDGEAIFQNTCKPCHTIRGGRLIGPDLAGLTDRRSEAWIIEFVQHSQAMVARDDSVAVALAEEYPGLVMPDWPLSDDEVRAVVDYIERQEASLGAGAAGQGAGAGGTAAPLAEGDPVAGAHLFQGTKALSNGGPACNSCHHVGAAGVVGGGTLAKDLTDIVERLGEAGTAAIMVAPPFPAMRTAFRDRPLTEQEVADLTAFLREKRALAEGGALAAWDAGALLLGFGAGAAAVLLASFALIWRGRRRTTVYEGVFARQVRSTTHTG